MEKAQSVLKRVASKLTAQRDYSERDYAGPEGGEEGFQFWHQNNNEDTNNSHNPDVEEEAYNGITGLIKRYGPEAVQAALDAYLDNSSSERNRHDTIDQS